MNLEDMLREENYQLKNEITDLKNAFDLNRDILKILSNHTANNDPQQQLFFQIITRLTSINNSAMISTVELVHQKNVFKQENFHLNQEIKALEEKVQNQITVAAKNCQNTESKMQTFQQNNSFRKEIEKLNEENINKNIEMQYWKNRCLNHDKDIRNTLDTEDIPIKTEGEERKMGFAPKRYKHQKEFRYQILWQEQKKQEKKLKRYIEDLENRILVFIKASQIGQKCINNAKTNRQPNQDTSMQIYEYKKKQVRLLKYALNKISLEKQDNDYILSITERFKESQIKNPLNQFEGFRSRSWPKTEWESKSDEWKHFDKKSDKKMEGSENESQQY